MSLSQSLVDSLAEAGISATIIRCHALINTADVRRAFLQIKDHTNEAKDIWPAGQAYSLEELEFAAQCCSTIDRGEDALYFAMKPVKLLESFTEDNELLKTLCVYLLDADSSVSRCAELLFVHKNTVKYRLGRIAEHLGYRVDKEPEKFYLYQAAALNRLLEKH